MKICHTEWKFPRTNKNLSTPLMLMNFIPRAVILKVWSTDPTKPLRHFQGVLGSKVFSQSHGDVIYLFTVSTFTLMVPKQR